MTNEVAFNRIVRALALIGAVAIVILIIGLGARLLKSPAQSVASLFSAISLSREKITVQASPSVVASGETLLVSWSHEKKAENGIYDFSYPCRAGLSVMTEAKEQIPCNSGFSVTGRTSLTLIAEIKDTASVDLPLTIAFTAEGEDRPSLSGTETVTITGRTTTPPSPNPNTGGSPTTGGDAPVEIPGERKTNTYTIPGSRAFDPNGYPDLALEGIRTGILVGDTFVPSTSVSQGQRAAILFSVKNNGTNISPEWKFKANLPIANGEFISETQTPLYPGDRIEFTLAFDNLNNQGTNTATLSVDHEAKIWKDPNRLNNVASVTLTRNY